MHNRTHKVGFVYSDVFMEHATPPMHPESKGRLTHILNALKGARCWDKVIHISPREATLEEIALAHAHEYIERMIHFGEGYYDPDTYISRGSVRAARFAVGAVLEAIERCRRGDIERAFCAVRPPGHHAEADHARGFCIFNNVAVGARYAQRIGYKKVFIVDFDVHHGNGIQHLFENDPTIFYFSTHQYPFYPGSGDAEEKGIGKGEGYTYNAPLPSGAEDKELIAVYRDILPSLVGGFRPDILLVSAGYDIHDDDPLASMRITDDGVREIVHSIITSAESPSVPLIFSLEGGYNLDALGRCVVITIDELLRT